MGIRNCAAQVGAFITFESQLISEEWDIKKLDIKKPDINHDLLKNGKAEKPKLWLFG
jgi:hypothetical protein